jgi:hypothetical protein
MTPIFGRQGPEVRILSLRPIKQGAFGRFCCFFTILDAGCLCYAAKKRLGVETDLPWGGDSRFEIQYHRFQAQDANRTTKMAEHKHGSMDITVQEKTYASFMTFVTRFTIGLVIFAVFLAIFAT